jgi:hypothetical protein
MASMTKTASRTKYRWRVSLITATPAKFVDFTLAPDAETAVEHVAEAHKISEEFELGHEAVNLVEPVEPAYGLAGQS